MGLLLLVRHGQASFGSADYDVLSETGWEQGRLLGASLAEQGLTPSVVVRGDMRRHRESAEAMVSAAGWAAPVEVDGRWDEFDHLAVVAAYPDLPRDRELGRREFQEVFEQATARWTSGVDDAGGGETYAAFVDRSRAALQAAAARAGSGESVVVVSSGGAIAAVCALLTGGSGVDAEAATLGGSWSRFNTVMVNSGVTRVVVGSTGARLLTFNEHPHLAGETLTYR